jgi:DMSO/TMAO reductase YedYZ molybdopterin-dependent catalytic subunit
LFLAVLRIISVTARVTDWTLAALTALLVISGALTLFAGGGRDAWVFAAHDALGFAIAVALVVKMRRVWPRVASVERWDRRAVPGLLALALVAGVLLAGLLWSNGDPGAVLGYSVLSWHEATGLVLAIAVAVHMALRAKRLRKRELSDRRQFLLVAGAAGASLLAWRLQRPLQAALGLPGASRRFTGSYDAGSFTGNAFPSTSWVADHPRPIAPASFRLTVDGLVANQLRLTLAELEPLDELIATLDCTGGFYSTQRWRGVSLARLLDRARPAPAARHLRVVSRSGYRWGFDLHDAHGLLLARYVGAEQLSHDHGAPLRLVVPGARGFQWVKWVERVELLSAPDYGAPVSTIWSSFTAAGSGGV